MAITSTGDISNGSGRTVGYTDPITGLPVYGTGDEPYMDTMPGLGVNPATGLPAVNVDYSGKTKKPYSGDGDRDPVTGRTKAGGVQPLSFTPPPAATTPPPAGSLNEYNQNRNNWYVAKGVATIKKPDGTEVPNPFDLTAEQIYFALSGDPQAILRLKKSLEETGHGDMFHNIVNYYEAGGGAFNGGGYTAADAARASANYKQGSRGAVGGDNPLGEWIGEKSPEALQFMIDHGQAVKGPDGRYYAPADPYYTPGVGAGAGTLEGDFYNGILNYDQAKEAYDAGKNKPAGSTLPGGSNYNPPGGGGTTPPVTYNPYDKENPWFSKQPTNKAAAPVIPGVSPPPKSTTTTSPGKTPAIGTQTPTLKGTQVTRTRGNELFPGSTTAPAPTSSNKPTTTSTSPTTTSPPPSTTNGAVSPTVNQLIRTR